MTDTTDTMNRINILVCDDDKEIAGAIEIYLRNEGYQVFKAYDGAEALRVAREQPLHLIIMDIMMPRMDGIQATMKIREEKNIPIIMLSAKSEDYDKIIGLNQAVQSAGAGRAGQVAAAALCASGEYRWQGRTKGVRTERRGICHRGTGCR